MGNNDLFLWRGNRFGKMVAEVPRGGLEPRSRWDGGDGVGSALRAQMLEGERKQTHPGGEAGLSPAGVNPSAHGAG